MSEALAKIYPDQQVEETKADVIDIESLRRKRLSRLAGRTAISGEVRLRNNDALAHTFLIQDGLRRGLELSDIENQIRVEYRYDMGERDEHTEFYDHFDYDVIGNELVSDTGLVMRDMLEDGLTAAKGDGLAYHIARAEVQATHTDILLDWANRDDDRLLMLSSLAPDSKEVAPEVAKLGNFKLERGMASMWLFQKIDQRVRMHVFSLDNLNLEGLDDILQDLGVEHDVSETTLEQLGRPIYLAAADGELTKEGIRHSHDSHLDAKVSDGGSHYYGIKDNPIRDRDANRMVREKPDAEELYYKAVWETAISLESGKVSAGLAEIVIDLRKAFSDVKVPPELQISWGKPISTSQARNFMDYLRRYALSEYIFGSAPATPSSNYEYSGGSGGGGGDSAASHSSIGDAGAHAVSNGSARDGSCPTSGGGANSQSAQANANGANVAIKNGMKRKLQVYESKSDWKWTMGYCVVSECEQKNNWVLVGPCSVCEKCQHNADSPPDALDILKEDMKRFGEELKAKQAAAAERNELAKLRQQKEKLAQEPMLSKAA